MDYLKTKGRIFDIQKFSIHDGPGIRTIVFLKGCVLRCKWCCNPESQSREIETMMVEGKPKIIGRDVTVDEIMQDVMKDMPYYRRSGGGVTLSGGESLCQAEFASDILKACKARGINTALESTACMNYEKIELLLPYLDYYLMDIKHIDSNKHKQFTSRGNELILENAKRLANASVNLIIRVPVIPTFNDTPEEIQAIVDFTKSLETVKDINLLPYHRLGMDKYAGLGREYLLPDIVPPTDEHMRRLQEIVDKAGLNGK